MEKSKEKQAGGWKFLLLSLLTFCGIMIEAVYAYLVEPAIWNVELGNFHTYSVSQNLIHWTATCISWGIVAYLMVRIAKKDISMMFLRKGL